MSICKNSLANDDDFMKALFTLNMSDSFVLPAYM